MKSGNTYTGKDVSLLTKCSKGELVMDTKKFNNLAMDLLDECKAVLNRKGVDYGNEKDRLSQFKTMAILQANTPRQALWNAATKHLTTIMNAIEGKVLTVEDIEHRIMDFINYMILLLAVIREEEEK